MHDFKISMAGGFASWAPQGSQSEPCGREAPALRTRVMRVNYKDRKLKDTHNMSKNLHIREAVVEESN